MLLSCAVSAHTAESDSVGHINSDSSASLRQEYCKVEKDISAYLRSERRFRSMGNFATGASLSGERRMLTQKRGVVDKSIDTTQTRRRPSAMLSWLTTPPVELSDTGRLCWQLKPDLLCLSRLAGAMEALANGMFLAPGQNNDVLYCSTVSYARVVWD